MSNLVSTHLPQQIQTLHPKEQNCPASHTGAASRAPGNHSPPARSGRTEARPGLILFVQTFEDLANFNPHLQVLAADGVFGADGTYIAISPAPEALRAEGLRRAVLEFLIANEVISEELCAKMLGWRYCGGFSAHTQERVARENREGRMKLACYMIRADGPGEDDLRCSHRHGDLPLEYAPGA